MNERYRRQTLLRSRRHRRGKLVACGCHPSRLKTWARREPMPTQTIVSAFCDPVWRIRTRRRVTNLPDLATFEPTVRSFQEAMLRLGPVTSRASETMRAMTEALRAEPE